MNFWHLQIKIIPGIIENQIWSPLTYHSVHCSGIQVEIVLDQIFLHAWDYRSGVYGNEWRFEDDPRSHRLEISVKGKSYIHMPMQDCRLIYDLCPKLQVWIQQVPIISDDANCFGTYQHPDGTIYPAGSIIGTNGVLAIDFSTPIYKWFVDNSQQICYNLGINFDKI